MRSSVAMAVGSVALLFACGPSPKPQCAVTLVDHIRWNILPEQGGDKGPCGRNDVTTEFFETTPSVSVDTTRCSRASLEQPSLIAVAASETMHIRMFHYALTSTASGDGLVTLALDNNEVWRQPVPLPSPVELIEDDVVLPAAIAVGAPVKWHVENHGDNTWNLVDLTVMGTCPEAD